MAVAASTAVDDGSRAPVTERFTAGPLRTCIGCRRRTIASDLLRVVVAPGDPRAITRVIPDVRRRLPGRGAWVHFDTDCVTLATRRRAFGRALRAPGEIDPTPVSEYLAQEVAARQRRAQHDRTTD